MTELLSKLTKHTKHKSGIASDEECLPIMDADGTDVEQAESLPDDRAVRSHAKHKHHGKHSEVPAEVHKAHPSGKKHHEQPVKHGDEESKHHMKYGVHESTPKESKRHQQDSSQKQKRKSSSGSTRSDVIPEILISRPGSVNSLAKDKKYDSRSSVDTVIDLDTSNLGQTKDNADRKHEKASTSNERHSKLVKPSLDESREKLGKKHHKTEHEVRIHEAAKVDQTKKGKHETYHEDHDGQSSNLQKRRHSDKERHSLKEPAEDKRNRSKERDMHDTKNVQGERSHQDRDPHVKQENVHKSHHSDDIHAHKTKRHEHERVSRENERYGATKKMEHDDENISSKSKGRGSDRSVKTIERDEEEHEQYKIHQKRRRTSDSSITEEFDDSKQLTFKVKPKSKTHVTNKDVSAERKEHSEDVAGKKHKSVTKTADIKFEKEKDTVTDIYKGVTGSKRTSTAKREDAQQRQSDSENVHQRIKHKDDSSKQSIKAHRGSNREIEIQTQPHEEADDVKRSRTKSDGEKPLHKRKETQQELQTRQLRLDRSPSDIKGRQLKDKSDDKLQRKHKGFERTDDREEPVKTERDDSDYDDDDYDSNKRGSSATQKDKEIGKESYRSSKEVGDLKHKKATMKRNEDESKDKSSAGVDDSHSDDKKSKGVQSELHPIKESVNKTALIVESDDSSGEILQSTYSEMSTEVPQQKHRRLSEVLKSYGNRLPERRSAAAMNSEVDSLVKVYEPALTGKFDDLFDDRDNLSNSNSTNDEEMRSPKRHKSYVSKKKVKKNLEDLIDEEKFDKALKKFM